MHVKLQKKLFVLIDGDVKLIHSFCCKLEAKLLRFYCKCFMLYTVFVHLLHFD